MAPDTRIFSPCKRCGERHGLVCLTPFTDEQTKYIDERRAAAKSKQWRCVECKRVLQSAVEPIRCFYGCMSITFAALTKADQEK